MIIPKLNIHQLIVYDFSIKAAILIQNFPFKNNFSINFLPKTVMQIVYIEQ